MISKSKVIKKYVTIKIFEENIFQENIVASKNVCLHGQKRAFTLFRTKICPLFVPENFKGQIGNKNQAEKGRNWITMEILNQLKDILVLSFSCLWLALLQ